jgi:hypothetical protein
MAPPFLPLTMTEGAAMERELEEAAADVERLTRLRDQAEPGSEEHRELNRKLIGARRRLYGIQFPKRPRR